MNFEIISLNDSELISSVESGLGKKVIKFESGKFVDSEIYIKSLGNVSLKNKSVLIIHQFSFEDKSINDQLLELLFLSDLVEKMGAVKISVLLPYYPYSRQDETLDGKFDGSLFLVDKLLKSSGISEIFCLELHKSDTIKKLTIKTTEISLIDFGVKFFKKNKGYLFDEIDICFLSPDQGRAKSIESIAKLAGVDFAYVKKKRIENDYSIPIELFGDVKNKNVIIIDDIIDTGNTAIGACDLVLKHGAKKVIGFFAHAVLSKGCVEKINNSSFEKIFVTDTVLIGDKIKNIEKISLTSLADILIKFLLVRYDFELSENNSE